MSRFRPSSSALLAAIVLAACGGGDDDGGGDARPDSEQVTSAVTDYAHAFGAGDGAEACSLLTPAARDAFTERVSTLVGTRDCAQAVEKLQAVAGPNVTGPFQEAKAGAPEIDGNRATVQLMAGSASEEVRLERQDGEWLLSHAPGT